MNVSDKNSPKTWNVLGLLEAVEKLRQPFQGNPIPLDTESVPVETDSDTPGFAPDGAGLGQNPRHMSLDF